MLLRVIILSNLLLLTQFCNSALSQSNQYYSSGEIRLALDKLNTLGSVMYIAAHPDDENTRLLSYLANERKYRTVYLSMTRGDGGQNLIGKEQSEQLGMIRTQELLAARCTDGAEQTFSRCIDFGYSKSPEETLNFWDKESALADVVWAIRKYRPDVIITRFPTTGEGGHGHHTASAILAVEAFDLANDPNQFPEQLKYVSIWQPKRIFFNSFNFRNRPPQDYEGQIKLDVGGYNALMGKSFGEIASESRSMHKSQGFGVAKNRGTQYEHFQGLKGDTAVSEILEGIDHTWMRVKEGAKIKSQIDNTIKQFDITKPWLSIQRLNEIHTLISKISDPYWKKVKLKEVENLIIACAGLWFEVNADNSYNVPGNVSSLKITAISRLLPGVKLKSIKVADFDTTMNATLNTNELFSYEKDLIIPTTTPLTNPYWLIEDHSFGLFTIDDINLRGTPWNTDQLTCTFTFIIEGKEFVLAQPLTYKWTDPVKGELYRPYEILPPVAIEINDKIVTFSGNTPREVKIKVISNLDSIAGTLNIKVPNGWLITPNNLELTLAGKIKEQELKLNITPPVPSDSSPNQTHSDLIISFNYNGIDYNQSVNRINYDHIPPLVSLSESTIKLVPITLKNNVKKIGYIEGAGDKVADCLQQMGFEVHILDEVAIKTGNLSQYGAIITGIRAYNTIENIQTYYNPLMQYIKDGGNLIVQYNTRNFLSSVESSIGPYPFEISRNRVTDEKAAVSFIDKNDPLLNFPNKITDKDFEGWVQERGLYFAENADPKYSTLLNWNDVGDDPLDGGLIYTKYEKGYFIYTGISFFRQLPAGVPGAYRLITNLINIGKQTQ